MHLHKIYHFIQIHWHLHNLSQPTAPCRQPQEGNHIKGTFKETAPLIVPTTSSGLRRHQLIPQLVKLPMFQVCKTKKMCVSKGAQITRSSVPSYQLILVKHSQQGKWLNRRSGAVRLHNSHPDCKVIQEKCKRTPNTLLRSCHCLPLKLLDNSGKNHLHHILSFHKEELKLTF